MGKSRIAYLVPYLPVTPTSEGLLAVTLRADLQLQHTFRSLRHFGCVDEVVVRLQCGIVRRRNVHSGRNDPQVVLWATYARSWRAMSKTVGRLDA